MSQPIREDSIDRLLRDLQNRVAALEQGLPKTYTIPSSTTYTIEHGRGRIVGAQFYNLDGTLNTAVVVSCPDPNNVTISSGVAVEGTLVVI